MLFDLGPGRLGLWIPVRDLLRLQYQLTVLDLDVADVVSVPRGTLARIFLVFHVGTFCTSDVIMAIVYLQWKYISGRNRGIHQKIKVRPTL